MGWKLLHCIRGVGATWLPTGGPCSATFRDAAGAEKRVEIKSLSVKIRGGRTWLLRVRDGEEKRVIYRTGARWVFGIDQGYFIQPFIRGDNYSEEVTVTQPLLNKIPRKWVFRGQEFTSEMEFRRARAGTVPGEQTAEAPAAGENAPAGQETTLPGTCGDGEVSNG